MFNWLEDKEDEKVILARGNVAELERIKRLPTDTYMRLLKYLSGQYGNSSGNSDQV